MPFWPEHFKDWVEIVKDLATFIALIIGGLWARWRFNLFREKHSKMELEFGITYLGHTANHHFIELQTDVVNKGLRSQRLYEFNLKIYAYTEGKELTVNEEQLKFTELLINDWWSPGYDETVDGGTIGKYTYLAAIPISVNYISATTAFYLTNKYKKGDGMYLRRSRQFTP